MVAQKTALERAFELAASGRVRSVAEIRYVLKSEGHAAAEIEGLSLTRQLRELIEKERKARAGR